ncbi:MULTISPECIES: tyrosine-type recombinase/integrase [Nocardia]|uniref:Phage integrase family protein n=1 Tax=Nocardia fluminea TaxID=134984 RepID=A0A2N3VHJ7_9NOCA|nr:MULTISPECIES: site-specific integrase [Nocardia]PKV81092.1 phage integrase family protein [Nocardia fluminea]
MPPKKSRSRATRHGFGRIRQLPSGRWHASYIGPDTGLHKAAHTFDIKSRAEGWLAAERTLIDLQTWEPPATRHQATDVPEPPTPVLFGAYAERIIATRVSRRGQPLSRRTADSYKSLLRLHLNPTFELTAVEDITLEMVRDWYSKVSRVRKRGRKSNPDQARTDVPTARARAYEVLRMVLNVAVEDGLIVKNPCRIKGATAVQPAHDPTVLSPAEIGNLAAAMPEKLSVSVLLAAWCGLRPSETFELRRRDFNADCSVMTVSFAATYREGKIEIGRPKSGSTGPVVIPSHIRPAVRTHLDRHVDSATTSLLFPDPETGKTMREWVYRRIFSAACVKIGRPDFRPGEQRHTGGTVAAQAGGTLAEIMERLRHKTPAAAMRYQKVGAGRAQALAENIAKLAKNDGAHSADQP